MATPDRLPNVTLRDAEILPGSWRNFAGEKGTYNAEGKRTFHVKLPEQVALQMQRDGFPIKELPPRDGDDGGEMAYRVEVEVSYKNRPPAIWLISGGHRTLLDEGSVSILDYSAIAKADIMINPYQWKLDTGKSGTKAYLHKMFVTLKEDELDLEYNDIPVSGTQPTFHDSEEEPF